MASSSTFLPRTAKEWAYFIAAVFAATIAVNTLLNRLPANLAGPLTTASRGL